MWRKEYGVLSPSGLKYMRQLKEKELRLKNQVPALSLTKQSCRMCWQKQACANGAGTCRHVMGPARGKYVLHCRSAADLSATVLWRQTTVRYAFVSGKSPKAVSTMATAGFMACLGRRAGGVIIKAFTGSIASRVCPCVSNAHAGVNRHCVGNPSVSGVVP